MQGYRSVGSEEGLNECEGLRSVKIRAGAVRRCEGGWWLIVRSQIASFEATLVPEGDERGRV